MSQQTLFEEPSTALVPRAKLDRRPITAHEWACVEAGLAEFNAQAGTKLGTLRGDGGLSESARMIGMRARHWPQLEPGDFRAIVRRGFVRPWWKGRPGVGVVFNPGVFERLVFAGPESSREDEFDQYLASLHAEREDVVDATAEEIR